MKRRLIDASNSSVSRDVHFTCPTCASSCSYGKSIKNRSDGPFLPRGHCASPSARSALTRTLEGHLCERTWTRRDDDDDNYDEDDTGTCFEPVLSRSSFIVEYLLTRGTRHPFDRETSKRTSSRERRCPCMQMSVPRARER